METKQLYLQDYDQVVGLLENRFATTMEFEKAKHKTFITLSKNEEEFAEFRRTLMIKWRNVIREKYLEGITHKLFGTYEGDNLMSMVGMRLVFEKSWVLSNLRTASVSFSKTGLPATMAMLYQHADDLKLNEFYYTIAEYRLAKFKLLTNKMIPEYYNKYEEKILGMIPAGTTSENDFWWSMCGRITSDADIVIIKKNRIQPF